MGNPSGPGDLPDFNFLIASFISDVVMTFSSLDLSESSSVGIAKLLKKSSTKAASQASEVYKLITDY